MALLLRVLKTNGLQWNNPSPKIFSKRLHFGAAFFIIPSFFHLVLKGVSRGRGRMLNNVSATEFGQHLQFTTLQKHLSKVSGWLNALIYRTDSPQSTRSLTEFLINHADGDFSPQITQINTEFFIFHLQISPMTRIF